MALHLKPDEFLKGKRLNWNKVAREQTAENERNDREGQPMTGHMVVSQKPEEQVMVLNTAEVKENEERNHAGSLSKSSSCTGRGLLGGVGGTCAHSCI